MSSRLTLQKPYVVATLPRPVDSNGRYVVGEVYGCAPGSKKRKRSELAVGVDGEGVFLYDIPTSRMITSYALPPQSSFTCSPCSVRSRVSKNKIDRRTYVSTKAADSQITLFRDFTQGSSTTEPSTVVRRLAKSQETVVFIGSVAASFPDHEGQDLILVKEDGEIQCLDGDELQDKWVSPPNALYSQIQGSKSVQVEYAYLTNAVTASRGVLKSRNDVFSAFPQEISEAGYNPDLLIIVTKSLRKTTVVWTLHVVSFPRKTTTHLNGLTHSVESLVTINLPGDVSHGGKSLSFNIHPSAGLIQILSSDTLTTFDLTESLPKEQSRIFSPDANSFLRLSNASVMFSSENSITVCNPKFQSILTSVELDSVITSEVTTKKRKSLDAKELHSKCSLSSYFPKLGIAAGITGNDLIAIQLEVSDENKHRALAGSLLIDSLGCAAPQLAQQERKAAKDLITTIQSKSIGPYIEALSDREGGWEEKIKETEKFFKEQDTVGFEEAIAKKLGIAALINGNVAPGNSFTANAVNPHWISYALSRIFTWDRSDTGQYHLNVSFYPERVFFWLLDTGSMTVANVEAALRQEIRSSHLGSIPPGELVRALAEIDPELDLLLGLIVKNYLGAAELLHAIKRLMNNLGLLGEERILKLLTNGVQPEIEEGRLDVEVERLEAEAEEDLRMAEYQLGPGSSIRENALGVALAKLHKCPPSDIINALQTMMTSQEIVSLIILLRSELARGAWTSRYFDDDESVLISDDSDLSDNSIVLISGLLNNCVDAIGAGGWLTGDVGLQGDHFEAEDLIAGLKLEVNAALEGLQEAATLKSLTSEMVRYGVEVQKAVPQYINDSDGSKRRKTKQPITLPSNTDLSMLPIGLKAERQVSLIKIASGGEMVKRTARDIGQLKSKKVGKYSRERIIL
ncbi:hypothetical protein F5884DRAFT_301956 [Xylogone sp. PMI_703]|nr:hypothetical protein F5884DRAFT_301956 [Xylogone sp. PMI_703]